MTQRFDERNNRSSLYVDRGSLFASNTVWFRVDDRAQRIAGPVSAVIFLDKAEAIRLAHHIMDIAMEVDNE